MCLLIVRVSNDLFIMETQFHIASLSLVLLSKSAFFTTFGRNILDNSYLISHEKHSY